MSAPFSVTSGRLSLFIAKCSLLFNDYFSDNAKWLQTGLLSVNVYHKWFDTLFPSDVLTSIASIRVMLSVDASCAMNVFQCREEINVVVIHPITRESWKPETDFSCSFCASSLFNSQLELFGRWSMQLLLFKTTCHASVNECFGRVFGVVSTDVVFCESVDAFLLCELTNRSVVSEHEFLLLLFYQLTEMSERNRNSHSTGHKKCCCCRVERRRLVFCLRSRYTQTTAEIMSSDIRRKNDCKQGKS